jgi:deazaflavin-dependent oxidoreductase (nitroreductase family)
MTEPTFARRPPEGLQRALLRVPRVLYRGPLAEVLRSRCVMLLTTRGRRTGRPRTTPVSFMPVADRFIVFSGWGVSSSWYHNVRANRNVLIQVGNKRMRAIAHVVEDPEQRAAYMRLMSARSAHCGPPAPVRPLLKLTRIFDYQGEIDMALAAGGTLPVIEIEPLPL